MLINTVSVQNAFHTLPTTYLVRMRMNGYRSEFQDSPVVMCGVQECLLVYTKCMHFTMPILPTAGKLRPGPG